MKKVLFILSSVALFTSNTFSQDVPKATVAAIPKDEPKKEEIKLGWHFATQFGINFSEAGFSENWKGGGVGNIALGLLFNQKVEYFQKDWSWTNELDLKYGIFKNKTESMSRKGLDRIFLDSKYARRISEHWNYFGNLNFQSQFAAGYTYDNVTNTPTYVSNFLSPGVLSEGIGVEYRPVKWFFLQLGGATLRQTFVYSDAVFLNTLKDGKSYGLSPKDENNPTNVVGRQTILNEMGFQVIAALDKDIAKNVNLKVRYATFFSYLPTVSLSHRLDLVATAKVNSFLNVNFTLVGIQDNKITTGIQLAHGIGVGFLISK